MPTIRRSRPWLTKPPMAVQVNQAHPFADSLRFFAALNEGSGSTTVGAANGLSLSLVNAPTWGAGQAGSGLVCTSNGQGVIASAPPYLQIALPLTFAASWKYLGTPVSGSPFIGLLNSNGTTNSRVISLENDQTTLTAIRFVYNGTSGSGNTGALSTLTDHVVVAKVLTTGTGAIWVDGRSLVTPGSISLLAYSSPSIMVGAGGSFFSARHLNSIIYWAGLWSRAMSDEEIVSISSSPTAIWKMFQPALGRPRFGSSAAAPAFKPYYASQQPVLGVGVY